MWWFSQKVKFTEENFTLALLKDTNRLFAFWFIYLILPSMIEIESMEIIHEKKWLKNNIFRQWLQQIKGLSTQLLCEDLLALNEKHTSITFKKFGYCLDV